jgi:hypothetical protein
MPKKTDKPNSGKVSAARSRKMIGESQELLKSSAQALEFSYIVLEEAQQRTAAGERAKRKLSLLTKPR